MPDNDPILSQIAANQPKPFDSIIQSGLVPGMQAPPQQAPLSGLMGTGGRLAYLGSALLQGIQRGKLMSYMAQEQKRQNAFKGQLVKLETAAQNPNLTDDQKFQIRQGIADLQASYYNSLMDEKKATKKSAKERDKVPDSERPSYPAGSAQLGASQKARQGDTLEKMKDAVGGLFQHLAGPNLPKSGQVDANFADTILGKVGAPGKETLIANAQKDLARTVGGLINNGIDPGQILNTPEVIEGQQHLRTLERQYNYREGSLDPPNLQNILPKQRMATAEAELMEQETGGAKGGQNLLDGGSGNPPEIRSRPNPSVYAPGVGNVPVPSQKPAEPYPVSLRNIVPVSIPGAGGNAGVAFAEAPPKETVPGNPRSAYYKAGLVKVSPQNMRYITGQYPNFKSGTMYLTSPDGTKTLEVTQVTPAEAPSGPRFLDPDNIVRDRDGSTGQREVDVSAMKSAGWTASRRDPSTVAGRQVWSTDPKDPTKDLAFNEKDGNLVPEIDPVTHQQAFRTKAEHATALEKRLTTIETQYDHNSASAIAWKRNALDRVNKALDNSGNLISFKSEEEKSEWVKKQKENINRLTEDSMKSYQELRQQQIDIANGEHGKPLSKASRLTLAEVNNNPGNIKDPVTGEFRQFDTPEEGWESLENEIRFKLSGRDKRVPETASILDFAKVWAPPSENNTEAWAKNVAEYLGGDSAGITPETPVAGYKNRVRDFANAIAHAEGSLGKIPRTAAPATPPPSPTAPGKGAVLSPDKKNVTLTWGDLINH